MRNANARKVNQLGVIMRTMIIDNHLEYWTTLAEAASGSLRISKNDTYMATHADLALDKNQPIFSLKDKLLNSILYFNEKSKKSDTSQALDLIHEFTKKNQPLCWWLGPDSSANIHEILADQLQYHGQLAGVYAKSFVDTASVKLPEGTRIVLLSKESEFDHWIQPLEAAYGLSPSGKKKYLEMFKSLLKTHPDRFAHFIAYQEDMPVACSSVFFGQTSAGLYNRASLPQAAKYCLRLAMHYMILYEFELAHQRGYEYISSQTSPRLLKAASRLGIKSVFEYEIYVSK